MFRTKTALHKHLSSAAHRCLSVVCPWCEGEEKTFTRVSDLEVHVRSSIHTGLPWKGKEYFTRQAGFYFALFPDDYARIVESVTPYNSDLAFEMRKAIRAWAERFEDRKERLDKWNKGWKEGEELARRRSKSKERDSRRSDSRRGVSKGKVSSKSERSDLKKSDISDCRVVVTAIDKASVNKKPGIDTKEAGGEKGNAKKRQSADMENSGESKQMKMQIEDDFDQYEYDIELTEEQKEINLTEKEINVAVNSILEGGGNETENLGTSDAGDKSSCNRTDMTDKRGDKDIGDRVENSERIDKSDRNRQRVIGDSGDNGTGQGSKDKSETKRKEAMDNSESDKTEQERGDIDKEDSNDMEVGVTIEGASSGDNNNTFKPNETLDDNNNTFSELETTSSSSSDSSTVSTSSFSDSRALRNRAMKLLTIGVMPLCPPARRIWTRNIELEINDVKLIWPPSNWRELTPESRLFAMEQIALALERKSIQEFPNITKKLLCDKYAFFMLDGQEKPVPGASESEKVPDKLRQYYSCFLRGIIKGDIPDSRQAWSIVKSLEKADRWTDTDTIINTLEAGGVKVKV